MPQPEWLDLKTLQRYACVSERTLREWIHRPVNPLPASRVGAKAKILVRRSAFARWVDGHQNEVAASAKGHRHHGQLH